MLASEVHDAGADETDKVQEEHIALLGKSRPIRMEQRARWRVTDNVQASGSGGL